MATFFAYNTGSFDSKTLKKEQGELVALYKLRDNFPGSFVHNGDDVEKHFNGEEITWKVSEKLSRAIDVKASEFSGDLLMINEDIFWSKATFWVHINTTTRECIMYAVDKMTEYLQDTTIQKSINGKFFQVPTDLEFMNKF